MRFAQALRARPHLLALAVLVALLALLVRLRVAPPPTLCVLGDAEARSQAVVPPELAMHAVDAARLGPGVGTAAIGNWETLGEALAVGGEAYVRSSDYGAPDYYRLLHGPRFLTSTFAYVPPGQAPRARLPVTAGQDFRALWRQLAADYPDGVLVAGYVRFRSLRTFAISRPAIRGLPVLANSTLYYTEPMESLADVWVYLVGLAARGNGPLVREDAPLFRRLLAQRADGALDSFAHALVLAEPPADPRQPPSPAQAVNVGRVMADSILEQGELALYPAYRLAACSDALVPVEGGAR